MSLYAERMKLLGSENAFKLGDNIQECISMGINVIKLNIGEPDFDTPEHICKHGMEQIRKGNTHYCPPAGIPALRKAIAKQVSDTRGIKIDPDQVIITTGGKPPISYTLITYVNPGDEVIYPSPGFPIYESWITFMEAKAVPLHLEESKAFRFTADDLERLVTRKTKVIFINSPSNPTGGVLTQDDLDGIADVIKRKCSPDVRIYSDEIYENIIFDGLKHASIASIPGMQERTLICSGHSKTYSMTGWRLGYAILPTKAEAEVFKNLNINIISCTSPFVQEAGREAYESAQSAASIKNMVNKFEERRNYAVPALNAISGITCAMPQGAFYLFPNIEGACRNLGIMELIEQLPADVRSKTFPSKLFQMFLLYKYGVATMDRKSFGQIGADGKHFIRLSIASSIENIKEGINRISRAVQDKSGFAAFIKEGKHLY